MKQSNHQNLQCFLWKTNRQKGLPRDKKMKTCSSLASRPQDGTTDTQYDRAACLPHPTRGHFQSTTPVPPHGVLSRSLPGSLTLQMDKSRAIFQWLTLYERCVLMGKNKISWKFCRWKGLNVIVNRLHSGLSQGFCILEKYLTADQFISPQKK